MTQNPPWNKGPGTYQGRAESVAKQRKGRTCMIKEGSLIATATVCSGSLAVGLGGAVSSPISSDTEEYNLVYFV